MNDWDYLRAQVHPGAGLVCRAPSGLLVVPSYGRRHLSAIDALLGAVRAAPPGSARVIARKVAAVIAASGPDDVPDLALLAFVAGDDLAVLVAGDVAVLAETAEGSVAMSGRESLTWVEQLVKAPTRVVTADGAPPVDDVGFNLVEGTVPASGVSLVRVHRAGRSHPGEGRNVPERVVMSGPAYSLSGEGPADGGAAPAHVQAPAVLSGALPATAPAAASAVSAGLDAGPNPHGGQVGQALEVDSLAVRPAAAAPAVMPAPDDRPASPVLQGPDLSATTDAAPAQQPEAEQVVIIDEPVLAGVGEPAPLTSSAPPSESVELVSLTEAPVEPREPLPMVEPDMPQPSAPAPSHEPPATGMIQGVFCKRGHFTDPDGQFCTVCGIGLYETQVPRLGRRPELGWLVLDNGLLLHLDHDYVLGRQPEKDPDVRSGKVRGLRLRDEGGTVSRAHAIVRLRGWDVLLADRASSNGTKVARAGSDEWLAVDRDHPVKLSPGCRIQLGKRTLTFENSRGRR